MNSPLNISTTSLMAALALSAGSASAGAPDEADSARPLRLAQAAPAAGKSPAPSKAAPPPAAGQPASGVQRVAPPAASPEEVKPGAPGAPVRTIRRPVYVPPDRGAPALRVNAGSRGAQEGSLSLHALAPDHPGLTAVDQPTVYWHLSDVSRAAVEVTVIREGRPEPLLSLALKEPSPRGVHRLAFGDHGLRLGPGEECQWVVAVVLDPRNRSKDLVATGLIRRVEPGEELRRRLETADPAERATVLAAGGYWYDSVEALMQLRRSNPSDPAHASSLTGLLEQVGLTGIGLAGGNP